MSSGRDRRNRLGPLILLLCCSLLACTATAVHEPTRTSVVAPMSTPFPATTPTATPDPPPASTPDPTPASTPTTTTAPVKSLATRHDEALAPVLATLAAALLAGDRKKFLAPFGPALAGRVGHWFGNTRAVGVSAARFARVDDFPSGATDSATSFTRTVVLGVRTPYDDDDSLPGVSYGLTAAVSTRAGRPHLTITSFKPKYLDDPMYCDCTLGVVHTDRAVVVADAADPDLAYWMNAALDATRGGIPWSDAQLTGSGLQVPTGQVIFLADKPFRWFIGQDSKPLTSNITAGLLDAGGRDPGSRYSDQSRIVLMLQSADGSIVPNNQRGRQYAADVLTHEATHQLMNRNSELAGRSADSPPTWVSEGIAVAVETLYRDSLGDSGDIGYPEPNDPGNIDPQWFRDHLTDDMPSRAQLYSGSAEDGAGYYALAGSVFRYLNREYGYPTMMKIAAAMYAKPGQTPFAAFPDPERPGHTLALQKAKDRWKQWFTDHYLS